MFTLNVDNIKRRKISVCLSAVGAIFYYRMDILLPKGHFLNNRPVRYLIYTINYPVLTLFSFPVLYIGERQRKVTKVDVFNVYHVVYPDIFKDDVIFGVLDSRNPDVYYAMVAYPAVVVYGLFLTTFSCYTIFNILKNYTITMSKFSKRQHFEVVHALIGMVRLFYRSYIYIFRLLL